MEFDFRKFDGTKVDLVSYVNAYIEEHDDVEIIVGTDSQNSGAQTIFCTVIALYRPGKGAHCIRQRWTTKRFRQYEMDRRLMKEVEASLDVAQEIKNNCWNEPKYIDLDINEDEEAGSNIVFQAAIGYVKGMGYKCRYKSLGQPPLVTTLADAVVKH